ncbi:MAG: acyl carrier protein [Bacteroidales bacterium]|nr:acyl carrier protein [Bacteroidales bacterium]
MSEIKVDRKEELREYVKGNTFKESNLIKDDTLIFQEGFFDSMGFVMLMDFIEQKFGVTTEDDDLIEENFESINAISDFIQRKLSN